MNPDIRDRFAVFLARMATTRPEIIKAKPEYASLTFEVLRAANADHERKRQNSRIDQ
ncbi:hypothetical protein [Streptomyces sp. cg36]|uniref:hypothetical protein n=1 Tax=Streptomyces sp. cg36 TaxID=3238798 RepID=UPI0034E2ADAD